MQCPKNAVVESATKKASYSGATKKASYSGATKLQLSRYLFNLAIPNPNIISKKIHAKVRKEMDYHKDINANANKQKFVQKSAGKIHLVMI
ncbi:hypothetical protein HK100_003033, partial [Physocladia obscura]